VDETLAAPWLPSFITEVFADRKRLLGLVGACAAISAAGLDPHVLDPGGFRGQALLLDDPESTGVLSASAVIQAGLLLIGGAIADSWRSKNLLRLALFGLVVASVGATLMPEGSGLTASRLLAWTSVGLIIPFAIGAVAILYQGTARATALGFLFAVYGATTILAPTLVTIFGPHGPEVQAFGLCALAALVAIYAVTHWLPDLPGALPTQRRLIVTTVLWAFGVIVITANLVQLEPVPLITGSILILMAIAIRFRGRRVDERGVDGRRVSATLAAGLVVGFAQSIPLVAMPIFFTRVQGIDGFLATVLIAPFVVALLITGPVSGWLLERFSPRLLLVGGVWGLALADLAFAVVMEPDAPYVVFIVPFLLVGIGFVIATVIRTAVIFASTPAQLPASAAALNESSIGVGLRIGALFVIWAQQNALRMAEWPLLDILRLILVFGAIVAIVGGIVTSFLLGSRDPLRSVWEFDDERAG
jgi:MFS family permease